MNAIRVAAVAALALILSCTALADESTDREIDHLLNVVANSDCVFIRNGGEHDPDAARKHLSLKRRRGKKYFSTADEFVDRLASSSSWSGKPYYIRCGDEVQQLAGDWFSAVLAKFRSSQ